MNVEVQKTDPLNMLFAATVIARVVDAMSFLAVPDLERRP